MKNVTYFFILFLLTLTTPLFADKNSNEEVLNCGFKATSSPF